MYFASGTATRPRLLRPGTTSCSQTMFGADTDAGQLETDLHPERAHGEMASRELAKPFGQAGLRFVGPLKENEPWLRDLAVPPRQDGSPAFHQVRNGQELRRRP